MTRYERNRSARRECLNHYGPTCCVCGFQFENVYGEIGKGYIHIHHLVDVAQKSGQYILDPIQDLRPVCPNCHAMLHTQTPARSIEELRQIIVQKQNGNEISSDVISRF